MSGKPRDRTRWAPHESSRLDVALCQRVFLVGNQYPQGRLHFIYYFTAQKLHDFAEINIPSMDPQMNKLLKWSVQNSQQNADGTAAPPSADQAARNLTPDMINALFGGPSEADLMKAAMEVLHSDESDLENKLIAFENFEQLIESIDNANNIEPLGLWTPLVKLLKHEEADMRRMAAWCVGTAVQNNEKAQDKVCTTATLAGPGFFEANL